MASFARFANTCSSDGTLTYTAGANSTDAESGSLQVALEGISGGAEEFFDGGVKKVKDSIKSDIYL